MTRFLKIFDILPGWLWAFFTAGFFSVALFAGYTLDHAKRQLSDLKAKHATELKDAAEADKAELERLTKDNQEIQREYMDTLKAFADYRADAARAERVRAAERKDIVDAAGRITRACGRYAEGAERDLEVTEGERSAFGLEAAAASATAHGLDRTLKARRAALEARRKALKPQEN